MRYLRFSLTLMLAVCAGVAPCLAAADPVTATANVPDTALQRLLHEILKRRAIDNPDLRIEDLQKIQFLNGHGRGIKDLTGLEHCTQLAEVNLSDNQIASVAPLSACVELQSLNLSRNQIRSVTSLATLKNLQYLNLEDNALTEIDAVAGMKKLSALFLDQNQIGSIAGLQNLPRLHSLYLADNKVADIKPLAGLAQLGSLDLRNNQISGVTPLHGLTRLRWTFLSGNRIADIAVLADMAKSDIDRRFAPYWRLYLADNPLNENTEAHITTLTQSGVRVTIRSPAEVVQSTAAEPTKDKSVSAQDENPPDTEPSE